MQLETTYLLHPETNSQYSCAQDSSVILKTLRSSIDKVHAFPAFSTRKYLVTGELRSECSHFVGADALELNTVLRAALKIPNHVRLQAVQPRSHLLHYIQGLCVRTTI
jgi:hypothetical protein